MASFIKDTNPKLNIWRTRPNHDLSFTSLEPQKDNSGTERKNAVIKRLNLYDAQYYDDCVRTDLGDFWRSGKKQFGEYCKEFKADRAALAKLPMGKEVISKPESILKRFPFTWRETKVVSDTTETSLNKKGLETLKKDIEAKVKKFTSDSIFLERLRDIISGKVASVGVTKIFALGGGTLTKTDEIGLQGCVQHLELLKIQDALGTGADGKKIPIYIQDPAYTQNDKDMAKLLGMTVVEDEYNKHEGWFHIDGSTLVVNLNVPYTTFSALVEIFRPLVILSHIVFPLDLTLWESYCIKVDSEDFIIPGNDTPRDTYVKFMRDYTVEEVDLDGVDPGEETDEEWKKDGFQGGTPLGSGVYIHKSALSKAQD